MPLDVQPEDVLRCRCGLLRAVGKPDPSGLTTSADLDLCFYRDYWGAQLLSRLLGLDGRGGYDIA